MLAAFPDLKKPLGYGRLLSVTAHSYWQRWIALTITLALHLLVLWLGSRSNTPSSPEGVHLVRLQYIALPPPIDKADSLREIEPPPIQSGQINMQLLPELSLQDDAQAAPELSAPLELNAPLASGNYLPQHETAAIAKNVFHPGLRKQLTGEANKPVLARVEENGGLQTFTDPSGATRVISKNGGCLRASTATKIGEPGNWYITGCGGKSESEKMLERVDQGATGD